MSSIQLHFIKLQQQIRLIELAAIEWTTADCFFSLFYTSLLISIRLFAGWLAFLFNCGLFDLIQIQDIESN